MAHILRFLTVLAVLAAPASAAGIDFSTFPFETEAGEQRGLVVYADAERRARLVFLSLDVERPSPDEAVLRPGGDGRVIVQVADGAGGFRTGAVLEFGTHALTLSRRGNRARLEGSLESIALPREDDPRRFRGRIAFEGLRIAASWPLRASEAFQNADFSMRASGGSVDAALLPGQGTAPVALGPVDLAGTVAVLLREDAVAATAPPVLRRIELDRAEATLLDGRIEARGVADFGREDPAALTGLRGIARLEGLPDMMAALLTAKLAGPRELLPLAAMARTFGAVGPDGALTFRVETAPEGVTVNGEPTGFVLRD